MNNNNMNDDQFNPENSYKKTSDSKKPKLEECCHKQLGFHQKASKSQSFVKWSIQHISRDIFGKNQLESLDCITSG